jgi:hypothetical protein
MKKLLTIAFALILGASLSFAQTGGGSTDKPADTGKTTKTKSGKKGHKGGKKSKKNSGGTTTPPPK